MNSQLYFESAPGFGSNIHFCLALPRTSIAAKKNNHVDKSPISRRLVSKKSQDGNRLLTALVVEDHPASRQIISLQLEVLGLEVQVCESASAALELLGQQDFDVLLTDQSIPGMQGSELAKHIRSLGHREIVIIGITADIYALDSRHQFLEAGMNGVLIKPLSLMTLENELSRYFQVEDSTKTTTQSNYQEEYSFDAFGNLLRNSPEYILVILEEIKKVHDEALLALRNEAVDKDTFSSMIHKVKGGAQLLSAAKFIKACESLEQAESLDLQIQAFIQLLEEQNQMIGRYQSRYAKL